MIDAVLSDDRAINTYVYDIQTQDCKLSYKVEIKLKFLIRI